MKQLIIIVILVVLSAIITLSTTEKLIVVEDGKEKKEIFKRRRKLKLSWRLPVLVFAFLGIIAVSIWQYSENEIQEKMRRKIAKDDQDNRDRIAEEKSNRRNDNTVKTITEALAKYNLEFDSANKVVINALKDSISNQKVIVSGPDPILTICENFEPGLKLIKENDLIYKLKINICSENASSTNFKTTTTAILSNSLSNPNDYIYLGTMPTISNTLKIPTGSSIVENLEIPVFNEPTDNFIFVLFKGTYSSIETNKIHEVNQLYFHNIKGKTWGVIKGETEKKVRDFISKNDKKI